MDAKEQIKFLEQGIELNEQFIKECDEALRMFDVTAMGGVTALRRYIESVKDGKSDRMKFYLNTWDSNLKTVEYILTNLYKDVAVLRNSAQDSVDSRLERLWELKESIEEKE